MSAATVTPINRVSLYEIEDNLLALADTGAGGVPQELNEEYLQALREAMTKAASKRDRVAEFVRHLETQVAFAALEIKRLQDRKRSLEAQRDRVEAYVLRVLDMTGKTKLEGEHFTLKKRKCPETVEIDNATLVPQDYCRHIPEAWEPDKMAIKAALLADATLFIPGADLHAGRYVLEVK